jgi:hypothetical protein
MSVRLLMRKTLGGSLQPIDDAGRELLSKIGASTILAVEWKRPRNVWFHRKLFAMLNIIFQNQSHYKSVDDLLDVCKLRTGHIRRISTTRGDVLIPKSISFAAMDEDSFSKFYDRAVDWMLTEVIPGLKRHDLDAAVEDELREFAA